MHKLAKALTRNERQAYEGANDFYRMVIPTVILATIIANIYSQIDFAGKKMKDMKTLLTIIIEAITAIISYAVALKFYKLCNSIDTTPVFAHSQSKEEGDMFINEEQSDRLLGTIKPQKFHCDICKVTCDYRTRHCRKCSVCIERYDHHCFWIGNCVGRHNHRQFYFFLLTQTINNVSVFMLISRIQPLEDWEWWLQLVGEVLALGFCGFTGYLLLYHTMLVSCGINTWQHMRRMKISYLKYLPPGFNPFSKGIIQNWHIFMTEQTRANGCQSIQNWQNYIVNFQQAKQLKAGCNIIENEYYSCC